MNSTETANFISYKLNQGKKLIAFLIDPDNYQGEKLSEAIKAIKQTSPDLIFIGGSLTVTDIDEVILQLKKQTTTPIILFPGNIYQLSPHADAILFISLISGRNPELLIGNHVLAAPIIKKHQIEVIPTGYILIDGGNRTSVEYMSQTRPIPADKTDIASATALAGEMLGMRCLYLEAGSGALNPVSQQMIKEVKSKITIPLIVGGGLNTTEKIEKACEAGADILVIGNALEKELSLLKSFVNTIHAY